MNNRQTAMAFFIGRGWTAAQAAGITANIEAESNYNPAAVGDGGAAYGICQWHRDRQINFQAALGKPIQGSSLEDQMAFVHWELVNTEKAAGQGLAQCTTATGAGAYVSRFYERPLDADGEAAKRAALAGTIIAEYATSSGSQDEPAAAQPSQEQPMGAALFLPAILQAIPELIGLFAKGPQGQTNAKAADVVVKALTTAAGTDGPGAALDKMQDATAAAQIKAAVLADPAINALVEVSGGAKGARDYDLALAQAPKPFYKVSAVFWMSVLLLPMMYWLVGSVIVGGVEATGWMAWLKLFGPTWTGETRAALASLVIGLVLGGICGVYYGVSVTQQRGQTSGASG